MDCFCNWHCNNKKNCKKNIFDCKQLQTKDKRTAVQLFLGGDTRSHDQCQHISCTLRGWSVTRTPFCYLEIPSRQLTQNFSVCWWHSVRSYTVTQDSKIVLHSCHHGQIKHRIMRLLFCFKRSIRLCLQQLGNSSLSFFFFLSLPDHCQNTAVLLVVLVL